MLTKRWIVWSSWSRLLLGMVVGFGLWGLPARVHAACGDYLQHQADWQITPDGSHQPVSSPVVPPTRTACRNGTCQPLPFVPTPLGSGVEARWFEVRVAWASLLGSLQGDSSPSVWARQADEVSTACAEAPPGPVPRS